RRSLPDRARREAARALLEGRQARLFLPASSSLQAGGALALDPPACGAAEAARRLREIAQGEASRGRAVWIAAGPETWDPLSRRAFETAERFLPPEIEVRRLPSTPPAPRLPDEWRREVWAPCGSIAATLRFYEWLAGEAGEEPAAVVEVVHASLASGGWGAFASDPTGQAPLPVPDAAPAGPEEALTAAAREVLTFLAAREAPVAAPELARSCGRTARSSLERLSRLGRVEETSSGWRPTSAGRRSAASGVERTVLCRRWAAREPDPARRIELLLSAGATAEAVSIGERWYRESVPVPVEKWFGLAARFAAAGIDRPPWLDLVEAERELAGGRPVEAWRILDRVAGSPVASGGERRCALLRGAEVRAILEGLPAAGLLAAAWRKEFPGAPPEEAVRALRLEAAGLARQGDHSAALERLDLADRLAEGLGQPAGLSNALARASVLSLAGRFGEEEQIYDRWRQAIFASGDDALAARFVSQEALALCDRRRFPEAAARLEEALAAFRDDPAERARLSIDLAATLYHAGRPERCAALLEEAASLAASAGRRDLLRIARSNRIELWVARAEWEPASSAIEEILEAARREQDELWLLVALHHRGRVALRRGALERAAEDNA
ncbi:MAG: hypothetical protein ACRD3M_00655, partial [Thermoanaerobaculia bacterium]